MRLFLLPGFGFDESMFEHLQLKDIEQIPINYPIPKPKEAFSDYAQRIIQLYNIQPSDSLLGVSLGGLLAITIQQQVPVAHFILISTISQNSERPLLFKILKRTGLYHFITPSILRFIVRQTKPFFGKNQTAYQSFVEIFAKNDPRFLTWGAKQCLFWKNTQDLPPHLRLHGDKDPLFPIKKIKDTQVIINGTHAMMRLRTQEIQKHIEAYFTRI